MLTENKNHNKSKTNLAEIAEVLGFMEESGKGKDWLFQEIKKHRIKSGIKASMNSVEILKQCPSDFISHILHLLKDGEFDDFKDIKTLTKTFHWFFTDIVGSANPSILTKDQARKVWALNEMIGSTETFRQRRKDDVMTITGDGMVIGFGDSPEKPLRLAMELHKIIARYNKTRGEKQKIKIRIGIETGPVYFIKDVTGKDNFWGPGIIMARRVMDLARPMQILASAKIAHYISKLSPEYKSTMHDIGNYVIKHGEKLSLYNVYGNNWGNKLAPSGKIEDVKFDEISNTALFKFPKVDLKLEITNSKTMLCRHTWIWHIINITDKPLDEVSYMLDGDVPKDFANLRVSVKDGNNHKLKIKSINANKPLHKEFIVQLQKKLRPKQKIILKLEYDWEEPERYFFYQLSTDCKKITYQLTAPRRLEIKPRVLKVDPTTGFKSLAKASPTVQYLKDKTIVLWSSSGIKAYNAYRFEW